MRAGRLPWEIVETLPWSDAGELAAHDAAAGDAISEADAVHHLVAAALLRYWAPSLGTTDDDAAVAAERRRAGVEGATVLARTAGDPDLLAVALLGGLYADWGPPEVGPRRILLDELEELRPRVHDQELRVRIVEWLVLDRFDAGDLAGAQRAIETFLIEADGLGSTLFTRREILWRANLAMLEGRIDEAVRMNEEAIASTADLAGSPFSFQNVAITMAIAGYFRHALHDLVGAVRSILASSPRVETNWEVGLTFTLSEIGELDECRGRFDRLAADDFAAIPRDLNWLVATQLLGLVAVNLDDGERALILRSQLAPYAELDATHGSGYASYGPVGRTIGLLAATVGDTTAARAHLAGVLESRAPGPWTTLARADRARLLIDDDPATALVEVARAEAELRDFGLDQRAAEMHAIGIDLRLRGSGEPIARLAGATWTLRHPSGGIDLRDGVGMAHVVELLRRPGVPIDVLDLDAEIDPSLPRAATTESVLDHQARRAYRERLRELEATDEATEAEQVEADFLRTELAGAVHVSASSAEIERARIRVTTAIRRTIDAISADAPGLGAHLRDGIATGRQCSYQPVDGVGWRIER